MHLTPNSQLIESLASVPTDWILTPIIDKAPKRNKWQSESLSREQLVKILEDARWTGYGLRTGAVSGGLVAVDVDGLSAIPVLNSMANGDLPETVSWTSNREGRYQLLFQVPSELQGILTKFTKKDIGQHGEFVCVDDEKVEIRYNNVQSCLPPSKHPQTAGYTWINDPSTPVAEAPQWLCDLLKSFVEVKKTKKLDRPAKEVHTEDSLVLAALHTINPDCDYADYLNILMALHSHNPDLLEEAIYWAEGSLNPNHVNQAAQITNKWRGFNSDGDITIGTLFFHAIEAGYKFPKSLSVELTEWIKVNVKSLTKSDTSYKVKGFGRSTVIDDLADFDVEDFKKQLKSDAISKNRWDGFKKGFPEEIVKAIEAKSEMLGVPCELFGLIFLTTMSADLNGKFKVEVNPVINWCEPLNLWTLVCGPQGVKKSPTISTILRPLTDLNETYYHEYEAARDQWISDVEEFKDKDNAKYRKENGISSTPPKEPECRFAYIGQATLEKLTVTIKSQQKSFNTGLLMYCDEINTQYSKLTAESGAEGATVFLTAYSGEPLSKSTIKDGYIGVKTATLSIIGGVQPEVYLKMMKKYSGDGQGFDERHLLSTISHECLKMIDHFNRTMPDCDLTEMSRKYFDKFRDLPNGGTIKMHPECYEMQNALEQWWFDNKAANAKPIGQVYRLAGIMACLWNPNNPIITLRELMAAWEGVRHSQACKKSITGSEDLGSNLINRASELFIKKGELTIGNLKASNSTVFGALSTSELSEIIGTVHEVCGGKLELNRQGNPRLTADVPKAKAKIEKTYNAPAIPEPTPVPPAAPKTVASKPVVEQVVDTTADSEVDCIQTGEVVTVPTENLGAKFRKFATPDQKYKLVSQTPEFVVISIPGVNKPVNINRLKLESEVKL